MKLPRQPQIVTVTVSCSHDGDCTDAKDLLVKHLENRFDQVQSWRTGSIDNDSAFTIMCYPRAVND